MKLDPVLTRALRLARRGRYNEAISALLAEELRYRDSFRFHQILALSCLYSGDFSGALEYFKRARDLRMRDPVILLGMAVLFIRRGQSDRAADIYLEVQDLDEKNSTVRRGLKVLRSYAGEGLSDWVDSGRLRRLYPPFPSLSPPRPWAALAIVLGALVLAGGGLLVRQRLMPVPASSRQGLSGTDLEREDRNSPVQTGGSYRYILTRKQVLDNYEEGRSLFAGGRDEAAKVRFNRILESNAAEGIKNKARTLLSYTEVPGFDTLKDRYGYQEVQAEPALYRDCHVIWRGMAVNVRDLDGETLLDFLVGYDTRTVMLGTVQVRFPRSVSVDTERPLEILGRVVPLAGGGIRLEGSALHQAAFLGTGRKP